MSKNAPKYQKMAKSTCLQDIVKHVVNGTLEENFCRICLLPLGSLYEDLFTTICKEDKEYCIADVLEQVCNIKILNTDESKVCASCFVSASEAYKFFLFAKRSEEILSFYAGEIRSQIDSINLTNDYSTDSVCITLPVLLPHTFNYDFNISKFPFKNRDKNSKFDCYKNTLPCKLKEEPEKIKVQNMHEFENDIVIVMNEDSVPTYYKILDDGSLILLDIGNDQLKELLKQVPQSERKKSRKRKPMEYKMCSRCPIRYRFVQKLKQHMKEEHGIDIFLCKVCQAVIEDEQEFNNHLQTHTGIHTCAICNMVFKKRETIITHFKWHEEMKAMSKMDGAHVCEVCGLIFRNAEDLNQHHEKKHVTKYTCYYCGRMYKGELSFELHIKKHEMNNDVKKGQDKSKLSTNKKRKRKYTCPRCNRDFVDERALLWHERLHTNERPYVCDVCGRAFVSLNRRNQHAVCAHTAPARRCPLCPALFHLRSMVNTHIKKVHLKANKRRNRTSKHQNVFWKTEPVPIQELSVSIQNEILELQAAQGGESFHKQK